MTLLSSCINVTSSYCLHSPFYDSNLVRLAADLCLSLDSFAFVDDSAAECAEVEAALGSKGVLVLHVNRKTPLATCLAIVSAVVPAPSHAHIL